MEYTDENLKILSEFDQYDNLMSENKSVDSNSNFIPSTLSKFNSDSDSKAKSNN